MTLVEARWDVARQALADAVRPLPAMALPVADCDGLVLAADMLALCALPPFDSSAMDGWAVSGPGPWTVVGESLAGRPVPGPLASGQAVVIATGGVVPAGADAVVRSEEGMFHHRADRQVLVAQPPAAGAHVRPHGEECAAGEVLARAGTLLTPSLLGLAAASGHDTLHVVPRPRVALVLFGDELATIGIPGPGQVRDSLGPQVPAWLARMGAGVALVERGADTLAAHVEAIRRAAALADLVLTTGGTAAGPVDHLHIAIAMCGGEVLVDSVAVRPGHPMLAGTVQGHPAPPNLPAGDGTVEAHPAPPDLPPGDGTVEAHPAPPDLPAGDGSAWIVGLPGNPQSAIVTLMSLGAPILAGLAGLPALPQLPVVTCAEPVSAPVHEDRLVLGRLDGGVFRPGTHLGSGMLRGLAGATGFAVLPPGGVAAGEQVRWLALPT